MRKDNHKPTAYKRATGMEIFLERVINARLTGSPDIARQAETG